MVPHNQAFHFYQSPVTCWATFHKAMSFFTADGRTLSQCPEDLFWNSSTGNCHKLQTASFLIPETYHKTASGRAHSPSFGAASVAAWIGSWALHCSGPHLSLATFLSPKIWVPTVECVVSRSKKSLLGAFFSVGKICKIQQLLSYLEEIILHIPDYQALNFYCVSGPWHFMEFIFKDLEHMLYQDLKCTSHILFAVSNSRVPSR